MVCRSPFLCFPDTYHRCLFVCLLQMISYFLPPHPPPPFFGFIFSPYFWACDPRSSLCELRLHHHRALFLYFYFCFRRESNLLFDCGIWADDEGCTAGDLCHNGPHRRNLPQNLPTARTREMTKNIHREVARERKNATGWIVCIRRRNGFAARFRPLGEFSLSFIISCRYVCFSLLRID